MQTVLVVDDEPLVVTLIARVLTDAGFCVLTTSEPEEALKICRCHETELDLLLTDLMMPGMNGRELRDRVAEVRPDLPVTYMSGYADSRACELMGRGAVDVLLKPFGLSALLTAVKKGIQRNEAAVGVDVLPRSSNSIPAFGDRLAKAC